MRRLVIAHWARQVGLTFFFLISIEAVSMMCSYASEEAGIGTQVDPAKAQSVKAKFMARLEEMGDISKGKERWLAVYTGLEDGIDKTDNVLREVEVELTNSKDRKGTSQVLRLRKALSQQRATFQVLQDLAARQYALLSKLELLDQSLKQKTLSRADYLIERAYISGQITHVEQLRLWENLADDVAYFLKEIADEVANVETAVWLRSK